MTFNPKFQITGNTMNSIAEIERIKGLLQGLDINTKNLIRLQKQNAVMESHYSTHIEGTTLTLQQSKDALAGKKVKGLDKNDLKELKNYMEALEDTASLAKVRISESLIKKLHKILVKGVRGDEASPGDYRKKQNHVVNAATGDVIYTPPPAGKVGVMMRELVGWINRKKTVHPVIAAAIAQFWFVHIHPFRDGNGRAARILSIMILNAAGYDFKRLFRLSEFYDKDRAKYYNAIQSARDMGLDLTYWVEYFTSGLHEQLKSVEKSVKISSEKGSEKILRFMKQNPLVSAAEMAEMLSISSRAVEKQIAQLKKQGRVKRDGADKGGRWITLREKVDPPSLKLRRTR
jgi:Fic family protein